MFRYKPAIWRGGALYELPRPVESLRIQDSWDFAQFKALLADGDFVEGRSQNGVDIAVEGVVGTRGGVLRGNEQAMFEELELLRAALGVGAPDETYELFLFHDAATATYRSFRVCTTVRFEYDLSTPALFSYSILIHAADATLYAAAPA